MPAREGCTELVVPGPALKRALQQVVFAASSDEARPVLTGVYVHAADGVVNFAATDSYRLAAKTLTKSVAEVDLDRKSVVEGTSGAVRVDLGGPRIIKKKNTRYKTKTI